MNENVDDRTTSVIYLDVTHQARKVLTVEDERLFRSAKFSK